ncbi:MAG: hypothetical protein OXT71_15765 [Acidobacteriota bacterium]|nr:hypothetical protein [Acidobacteriota bacterium]
MPAAPVRNLIRFVWRRYPPLPYVAWVSLWTCALEGLLERPERLVDRLDVPVVLTGLSLFLVSFFMRVVDEIRDYEYDRVHHPERELAAGVVSFSDLYLLLAITAVILLALNAGRPVGAGVLGAIMAYSLFLWWLEVRWRFYRERMFFAIGVAIQLHVLQAIYVWVVRPDSTADAPAMSVVFAIASFVLAYLHWEVARKTRWPTAGTPAAKLYSTEVGAVASSAISLGLMTAAVTFLSFILQPWQQCGASVGWLVLAPWVCSLLNTLGFLLRTPGEHRLGPGAAIAYFSFLGIVVLGTL